MTICTLAYFMHLFPATMSSFNTLPHRPTKTSASPRSLAGVTHNARLANAAHARAVRARYHADQKMLQAKIAMDAAKEAQRVAREARAEHLSSKHGNAMPVIMSRDYRPSMHNRRIQPRPEDSYDSDPFSSTTEDENDDDGAQTPCPRSPISFTDPLIPVNHYSNTSGDVSESALLTQNRQKIASKADLVRSYASPPSSANARPRPHPVPTKDISDDIVARLTGSRQAHHTATVRFFWGNDNHQHTYDYSFYLCNDLLPHLCDGAREFEAYGRKYVITPRKLPNYHFSGTTEKCMDLAISAMQEGQMSLHTAHPQIRMEYTRRIDQVLTRVVITHAAFYYRKVLGYDNHRCIMYNDRPFHLFYNKLNIQNSPDDANFLRDIFNNRLIESHEIVDFSFNMRPEIRNISKKDKISSQEIYDVVKDAVNGSKNAPRHDYNIRYTHCDIYTKQ